MRLGSGGTTSHASMIVFVLPLSGEFLVVSYCLLMCRPAPPEPVPTTSAAPSSPPRDPNSQAIWSPDTPEYTPQYTCQYSEEEAGQEVGEMQLDSGEEGEDRNAASAPAPSNLQSSPASGSTAHVQAAYGSGSVTPFALHRSGK